MASLFPDDTSRPARPSGGFRAYPKRPKAVETEAPPLPAGWIVAQCDGGARGNPGPAGFGATIDAGDGQRLAELSEFLGFRTNNYAEYSGLLAVLDWALAEGHTKLRLISDSELMVKQIQGKYKVNSPDLKPLFEEARRRISKLDAFEIRHALRHKNKDADRLANEAMDRGTGKGRAKGEPELPTRAIPYPASTAAPPMPSSFGGVQVKAQPLVPITGSRPTISTPAPPTSQPAVQAAPQAMLRGFVRDGVVHLLGQGRLPEGSFVKIVPE